MTKQNLLKILDIGSYVSLIIASILVLLYEFVGEAVLMKVSVVVYGVAFLMLVVLCVMKLIFMKHDAKENDELLVDKTKEKTALIYVKLVFGAICFAFTVVFFAMF